MWLRTECDFTFDVSVPTPFILMLRPRSGLHQWVARESYTLTPSVPAMEFTDSYGNLCQRLIAPLGEFSIRTSADIMTADYIDTCSGAPFEEVQNLPDAVLTYLLPSRYCESDRFIDMAQEIVMGVLPGYDQVAVIEQWIRTHIRFDPSAEQYQLSALQVNQVRAGVCRDLAHFGIALCRGLCIPARMVVGFLYELQPMDFHAWFEAYVGGRWYTFDATQVVPRGGRVTVAYGHDAADVAIFNQFGPMLSPNLMQVRVTKLANAPNADAPNF
ncbi:MAG: transglutaminase family protein [Methylophilaceae bacterium]|nr:transglutaminase family protein [Methylophilaceae bacterium]